MAKKLQFKRLMLLALLLGAGFGGLCLRLVDLQVWRHDELRAEACEFTSREILLEPRRGDILDAKGNPLATSVFVKTVCADPALIGRYQVEVARALSPFLQIEETRLVQMLAQRVHENENGEMVTNQYVRLKQKVPIETWDKIRSAMTNLSFGVDEKSLSKTERAYYR